MTLLSLPEVAERYSIPLRTIQAACQSGSIQAVRISRMWLVYPDQAEEFARRWRPRASGRLEE